MDLPAAIGEFAEMLSLGSRALERLIERKNQSGAPVSSNVDALLQESQDISRRLHAIADELRRHSVS